MPTTSTFETPLSRSHCVSERPSGPTPSNPEYAAAWAPLENTASTAVTSSSGWNDAPAVPATQCAGQVSTKSGFSLKCAPGSMW